MNTLNVVEEKLWYLYAGLIALLVTVLCVSRLEGSVSGELLLELHGALGFGLIYAEMAFWIIPSVVFAVLAVLLIKRGIGVFDALLVVAPVAAFHVLAGYGGGVPNPSELQAAIIHLLALYVTIRVVATHFNFSVSVLGTQQRPLPYVACVTGMMICLPVATFFSVGRLMDGSGDYISVALFAVWSTVFFVSKKVSSKMMGWVALVTLLMVFYFLVLSFSKLLEMN